MQDRVHSIYSIIEICICFPEQLLLFVQKVLPVEAVAVVGVVIGVVQVPIHQVLVEAMAEEVEDYNGKNFYI